MAGEAQSSGEAKLHFGEITRELEMLAEGATEVHKSYWKKEVPAGDIVFKLTHAISKPAPWETVVSYTLEEWSAEGELIDRFGFSATERTLHRKSLPTNNPEDWQAFEDARHRLGQTITEQAEDA